MHLLDVPWRFPSETSTVRCLSRKQITERTKRNLALANVRNQWRT